MGLGLDGAWIRLEPVGTVDDPETAAVLQRRDMHPAVGMQAASGERLVPAMIVRDKRSGKPVGVVDNHELPGKIAILVIYLDPGGRHAGAGMEALILYISHLFDNGARLVDAEILEFNRAMLGVLDKVHLVPQARMREHIYRGGRMWDLLVYSFDREEWLEKVIKPWRPILPGGSHRPAAIGVRQPREK